MVCNLYLMGWGWLRIKRSARLYGDTEAWWVWFVFLGAGAFFGVSFLCAFYGFANVFIVVP